MPAGRKPTSEERQDRGKRLAGLLRQRRDRKGLSQQLVAEQSRIAYTTLRKIESGETHDPGFFTVVDIARVLGLTLDELAKPFPRGRR